MPTLFPNLSPFACEMIGVAGFALYVLSYGLISFHRITSSSRAYFGLNLVAASLVLIGLTHSFNLASALIQGFWIAISLAALFMRPRQLQRTQSGADYKRPATS